MLWFMQVVFLQTYYSTMKKAETAQLGTEVESAFVSALDYKDQIDNITKRSSVLSCKGLFQNSYIYRDNNYIIDFTNF